MFFTAESAFIVINFKYDQMNVRDRGQVLVALEFSNTTRRSRSVYYLYTTTIFGRSTKALLSASAPYIAKAVELAFLAQ